MARTSKNRRPEPDDPELEPRVTADKSVDDLQRAMVLEAVAGLRVCSPYQHKPVEDQFRLGQVLLRNRDALCYVPLLARHSISPGGYGRV